MMKIKFWIVTLSLCLISSLVHAQRGFHVIRKAERKYEAGKGKAALRLLNRAEKLDYGFCGNSWMGASRSIGLLRARIYIDYQKYQQARNSLDSIFWDYESDNTDSIRIKTYQLEFGKSRLSHSVDSAMKSAYLECKRHECYVVIPMEALTCNLRFKMDDFFLDLSLVENDEEKKLRDWMRQFHTSGNYELAKEQ